jgi:cytochrome c2
MKFAATSATALALVLALSACDSGPRETESAPAATSAATDTAPLPAASAMPAETAAPNATPSDAASAAPTASPAPSASASAAPAAVAAVEPAAFAQCKACHSAEPGKNGIGPSLAGIYGEKAATVPGFDFSDGMKDSGLAWNEANLDRFLTDPKGTVPGTKMSFGGIKDAAKRKAIIDYIKGL